MFSIKDKVTLVTGGGSGIGLAIVKRFVAAGARVAFCTRSDKSIMAKELGATFVQADVSDAPQVAKLMQQVHDLLGPIEVLVNNAGTWDFDCPIETGDSEAFRRNFDLNVMGTLYCIKYAAPLMKDGGAIINICSMSAHIGMPGYGAYNASKAGQSALTRTAAIELADRGIRVVDICPATVATETLIGDAGAAAEVAFCSRLTPLKRICEMDEVAATVHFLAADDCRYITGSTILLDGGFRAGISTGLGELVLRDVE
jgi:NAD(P)-dependent dehydrogenase (short-subunit alcohol dehydrogenase family)